MVQAVENRTEIAGRVTAIRADPIRPSHLILTVTVNCASRVEGFADMFSDASGSQLDVHMERTFAERLPVDSRVRCLIRRADPQTILGEPCPVS